MIVVGCMQWAWASYPQIQQQWLLLSAVFPCCNAPQPMLPLWYVLVVNVCFCMPVFKQHQCWFAGQTQRAGESVLVLHTNGTDRSKWPHQRPSAGCHFRLFSRRESCWISSTMLVNSLEKVQAWNLEMLVVGAQRSRRASTSRICCSGYGR